jgi:hypothetical protein
MESFRKRRDNSNHNLFLRITRENNIKLNKYLKINKDTFTLNSDWRTTINTAIYLYNNKKNYINNVIIKSNPNYIIYKELNTSAYIMSFPNLLMIVFDKDDTSLNEFKMLYDDSKDYLFSVYSDENNYYVFCISKYKEFMESTELKENISINLESDISIKKRRTKVKLLNWLISNDCSLKYISLSTVYDSFLVINRNWNCKDNNIVKIDNIGKAEKIKDIDLLVTSCISTINKYYIPTLPLNYLDI